VLGGEGFTCGALCEETGRRVVIRRWKGEGSRALRKLRLGARDLALLAKRWSDAAGRTLAVWPNR
jgi:hypothetical protein